MSDDDSEWRFGVDDVGPDATDDAAETTTEADADPTGEGSVAGNMDREMPVEPEPVELESALFVLFGVAVTLLVFVQFVVG